MGTWRATKVVSNVCSGCRETWKVEELKDTKNEKEEQPKEDDQAEEKDGNDV
jgi:hypothetical protein